MESHKVTLVIGSFNPNLEWLEVALKSAEGLFDEIVLVDDGSQIPIPEFAGVKTIRHETNKGFYIARNTGVQNATGDVIASLDDDDFFVRDGVAELRKFIDENDSDIWHFPIMLFGLEEGEWGRPYAFELPEVNPIPSGSWFKKSVWETLNGFQYPDAEDWDFWARAHKKKFQFKYFPQVVYHHRMREGSLSYSWRGKKIIQMKKDILARYAKA